MYLHNSDEFLWVATADERETIDEKIGLSERMKDLVSARSYEIKPFSHSVRESQLDPAISILR